MTAVNVRKTFRAGTGHIVAVGELSLDIAPGSVVAISGPSGSGKSTLLHLIGAIETPHHGTITVGAPR